MKEDMSSYFEEPEFKESLAKYEGMVESHAPAYFDAGELTDIAEFYASNGKQEEADKAIAFALQLHPNDTDALIFRARSLAFKGQLKEAYRVMELIEDPSDREVKFLQADLLMEEGRIKEADRVLERLAQDEDEDFESLLDIIQAYIDNDRKEYARKWIRRLADCYDTRELEEKSQLYRDVMYDYYLTFHEPEKAIPLLQASLDKHPYSIGRWNDLGKCNLEAGNLEEAHEAIDFALAIDDKNPEALALKALCCRESDDPEEACRYLLRLADMGYRETSTCLLLVKTYLELQAYDKAARYADKLLEHEQELTDDEKREAYCYAAISYACHGQRRKGDYFMDKALEAGGDLPEIQVAAGQYLLILGEEDKAIGFFERAIHTATDDRKPDILISVADICFHTGMFATATHYYKQLCHNYPEQAPSTYFPLLYCSYYEKNLPAFLHYISKIRKELPELYATLGTDGKGVCRDDVFNELVREMKQSIDCGDIDLDIYL